MKNLSTEDYLALPYTIEIHRDDSNGDTGWVASVAELPGCLTQADTFEELEEMIQDAMHGWIETALEDGQPVPIPRTVDSYSGKFVVRVPRSLHKQLATAAQKDGVSLNTFVNVALGRAITA